MQISLPPQFAALEPYAKTWGALTTQNDRYIFRQVQSMEDLRAFYDTAAPMLEEAFCHLEKFPMNDLPTPEAMLYRTIAGLTEAGLAIEIFDEPGVPYAPKPHNISIRWRTASAVR